jgi:5-dehydro-2-deoxygluconokinase
MNRPLELICLGRAAVDFYGEQIGGRLEDMQSFTKYLGGSSANLCAGVARLGLRSSMLTRVGDEHMGRFVREALAAFGADVGHVKTDPDRLTASVVLGIEGVGSYPHIFFRENCADMGVCVDDFDESYIASSAAFAVTGTHLSTERTRAAVEQAIRWAKNNGTKCILDIDYRPALWRLTAAGEGASRFVASETVTGSLQPLLPFCDLVVGTEEEIRVAGGTDDVLAAIRRIRSLTSAAIVIKRGATGCAIVPGEVPADLDQALVVPGYPVEVLNVLGAGDAFLSGFLSGWLRGASLEECGRLGNACGALVVSRHACSPAMPSQAELRDFMNRPTPPRRPDLDNASSTCTTRPRCAAVVRVICSCSPSIIAGSWKSWRTNSASRARISRHSRSSSLSRLIASPQRRASPEAWASSSTHGMARRFSRSSPIRIPGWRVPSNYPVRGR